MDRQKVVREPRDVRVTVRTQPRRRGGGRGHPRQPCISLVVKHRQVEHVAAAVAPRRDRVTECLPVGHVLEADQFTADVVGLIHEHATSDWNARAFVGALVDGLERMQQYIDAYEESQQKVGEVLAEETPDAVDGLDDDEIAAMSELMQQYDLDDMVEADVADLAEELEDRPGF